MQILCISCVLATLLVIVYKTILFLGGPKYRRKLIYWFYFNRYERANSGSGRSLLFKRRQNLLTILMFVLVFATLICVSIWRDTAA